MDNKAEQTESESKQQETTNKRLLAIDITNPDVLTILGLPCFVCGGLAHILRNGGNKIACKAEAEQAYVIAWLLTLWCEHGALWQAESTKALQAAIDASHVAAEPKVTQP